MPIGLVEARNLLVRRWGEMGGYWGINRTMAEIHALLFVTRLPLCTDDIMQQLQISRGNASMNLRGLVDWGLISRVHKLGDRKEYFEADTDIWHMFETIMRERRRREVEPVIATLERCSEVAEADDGRSATAAPEDIREFRLRVQRLKQFLATMGTLFEMLIQVGPAGVEQFAALAQGTTESTPPRAATKPKKRKLAAAR
jgi:DNA-binding transcriptional regulator GbsR (MarR family)